MVENYSMEHITPEELADYCAARVPAAREEVIEAHLAVCDACVEEARQCYAFAAIWEEWTGVIAGDIEAYPVGQRALASQDDVVEQGVLQDALEQIQNQEDNSAWRERLARWQTHWQGRAAAAVRLVVEATDQAARVVTEGLETLMLPGQAWGFALASAQEFARGAGEDRGVAKGEGAAASEPVSPQVTIRVGPPSSEATRLMQVGLQALPTWQTPPLVLLIPTTAGGTPQIAMLEPRQGSPWLVAYFRNVPQGDYLLAFEPMEDTDPV
jgi:hypothetical protein